MIHPNSVRKVAAPPAPAWGSPGFVAAGAPSARPSRCDQEPLRRVSGLSPARSGPAKAGLSELRGLVVTLLLPHRQVGLPAALISLGCHDLVDMASEIPALAPPRVDVVGEGDGLVAPGRSLRGPDTPVLIEGPSAVDGRCVDSLGPIQVVRATITADGADRRSSGRPPAAPAVDDVVLDEWVSRPPIESQIRIAGGRPDAGVVADSPDSTIRYSNLYRKRDSRNPDSR